VFTLPSVSSELLDVLKIEADGVAFLIEAFDAFLFPASSVIAGCSKGDIGRMGCNESRPYEL